MGTANGDTDETPVHEQCFSAPFWIDRTEVTRAMYTQCVEAGACTPAETPESSTGEQQPINGVSWYQASTYCTWRGGYLPAEVEWEYTARGPDNLIYPWGNTFESSMVTFRENSSDTDDVESHENGASWVGVLNMSGNVTEWTSTIYAGYPYIPDDGRENPGNNRRLRVLRGGSYLVEMIHVRAVDRDAFNPAIGANSIGFRCARSYED